jgi:hypothetical protein
MEKNSGELKADLPSKTGEKWVWGDEVEYTREQVEGMVKILEYLIINSHRHSTAEHLDNGKPGWTEEELEDLLNKLNRKKDGKVFGN